MSMWLVSEVRDLKHDIERHVAICAEQATRIAELEAALDMLRRQAVHSPGSDWVLVNYVDWEKAMPKPTKE